MAEQDPAGLGETVRSQIQIEAASIAATPEFLRAPVMLRLLRFLVAETLCGRGDQLKAYAVAVDGLGRPSDFDAHYARHAPQAGLRLAVPSGGYRVTLEPDAQASGADKAEEKWPSPRRRRFGAIAVTIFLAGIIFAPVTTLLQRAQSEASPTIKLVPPPMLILAPIVARHADAERSDALRAALLDALARSDMVRLKAPRMQGPSDPVPIAPRYALGGDLTEGGKQVLYLRLWRMAPDRLIWSERITLPRDPTLFSEALAPALAALTQPYGAIATNERAERDQSLAPGYPCLLRFDQYRAERTAARHAEASRCIAETLALAPRNASALAAASILALDEDVHGMPAAAPGRPVDRALSFAKQAVAADPFSALANLALARTSLYFRNCPAAVRAGRRAAGLSPYDPPMMANVGTFLIACEDPRGEALVRRAIALDPNAPAFFAPLVYVAIGRGDTAGALKAAMQMEESAAAGIGFHQLTMAVALAANGDLPRAKAAWNRLAAADPAMARDPEALFRRWRFSSPIREKSLAHLRSAGLIPPGPPAGPSREPVSPQDR